MRRRLLFLCHTLPYPPDGGVWIRTYHTIRLLSTAFDVTALCFERSGSAAGSHDPVAAARALGNLARVDVFRVPQAHSRLRLVWDHARSVLRRRAYTRYLYESRAFRTRLSELLEREIFDLVHVDSLDLAAYLPLLDALPVVCVHHNVESDLLARRARAEPRGPRRAYLALQARLTLQEEIRWCPEVAMNVVVSQADGERLSQLAGGGEYLVFPNGVDTERFAPCQVGAGSEPLLVFVGGTSWFPNRDALDFFCGQILPMLRQECHELSVRWVGRSTPEEKRWYADEYGVELAGYVEDVRPYVRDAVCYVVPLRVGGGTRLKILDAWAMGMAVVSTSVGCEGLDARDGENILIRDAPAGFAEAVLRVIADPELGRRLARNARRTAEKQYSWDVIGGPMIRAYELLLDPAGQSRA